MSAGSLVGLEGEWSDRRAGPEGKPGHSGGDPVAELAEHFAPVCRQAVDVDEIAAHLEASGIGDRVAATRYGYPDVFALAAELQRRVPVVAIPMVPAGMPLPVSVRQALIRWTLYLTPLAIVLGAAREVGHVPVAVTTGVLVLGWAVSQGLAYLGYTAVGRSGPTAAARFLAVAFAIVIAGCLYVVWHLVPPPVRTTSLVVAGGELGLFAAVAVTLVTGREARLACWAAPCWLAAGSLAVTRTGLPGPGYTAMAQNVALALLLASITAVFLVAFRPIFGRGWSWRYDVRDAGRALGYTVVGASQAGLFVIFLIYGAAGSSWRSHVAGLPMLLATPLTEVLVLRHRERIFRALHVFEDIASFRQYARSAVARSLTMLALPVGLGGGVALGASVELQRPEVLRYGLALVLSGLFAVTLLLALHRRLFMAIALIATPALLTVAVAWSVLTVDWSWRFLTLTDAVVALLPVGFAALAVAFTTGLALCHAALLDPRSYL